MQGMALHAIVGLQTGDEGKGVWVDRIIDDPSLLGLEDKVFAVVKTNGADNAGHSITLDLADAMGKIIVCKLYDSGVKHKDIQHIFGSYVACNLLSLKWELEELRARLPHDPLETSHFSDKMSLIFPYHRIRDLASEHFRAKRFGAPTGTTGRGVRPAYADLANRDGIRAFSLHDKDEFARGITYHCEKAVAIIKHVFEAKHGDFRSFFRTISQKDARRVDPLQKVGLRFTSDFTRFMDKRRFAFNIDQIIDEYWEMGQEIVNRVGDIGGYCNRHLRRGQEFLGEVSQGFLLDVVEGLPPNTTSSQTTSGIVPLSMGIAPQYLRNVLGVTKAYETKVGAHVFPEEFTPNHFPRLYEQLKVFEFGSVTGRQRMVGALSMPTLRRAVRVNGVTHLAINKVDVMDGAGPIPMTHQYIGPSCGDGAHGGLYHFTPSDNGLFEKMKAELKMYDGFNQDLRDCKSREDFPQSIQLMFSDIEKDLQRFTDLTLFGVGVGPNRQDYVKW